jgi:hypothetical protein
MILQPGRSFCEMSSRTKEDPSSVNRDHAFLMGNKLRLKGTKRNVFVTASSKKTPLKPQTYRLELYLKDVAVLKPLSGVHSVYRSRIVVLSLTLSLPCCCSSSTVTVMRA